VGLIVFFALSAGPAAAQDIMTRAKNLYQTAEYDEALALLDQLKGDPVAEAMPDVAAYRVFCLLALGKDAEAQAGIAGILRRDPGYQPSETETSPRIRAVFQDVRRRLLPQVFQERYSAAKATFERKDYRSAADQFKMLLLLVDDPLVAGEDSRRDLRMLISGFADIAQASVNTQAPAPARGATPAQPTVSVAAMRLPAGPNQIYTAVDAGVSPPVAVVKTVPSFRPGGADLTREFTGVVEVLVNEKGDVAEAKIQKSVYPVYDPRLIAAARQWKFRPAVKDGQPVSYRTYIEVKLVPTPRP
jgi:TonB family protein